MLLSGEMTSTEDTPARGHYARLAKIEEDPSIWDASFQVGYFWADEPRATAAAVVTGDDPARVQAAASDLAQAYWAARESFVFGMESLPLADCVARAVACRTAPVVLADSGDNPTGGGVGDRADMLAALIAAGATAILAGIADAPATDQAYAAGVGATLTMTVAGTLDPASAPVKIVAKVRFLLPTPDAALREAVVDLAGITLVLTAKRRPFHAIADFTRLGLNPHHCKILAVKSGYLSPELAPLANPGLMALTEGVVDQALSRLPRGRRPDPTYPFDSTFDWQPEVRAGAPRLS